MSGGGVKGDFAGLKKLASNLGRLSEVPSCAAVASSERIASLISEEFAEQADPYGNPWADHTEETIKRWGEHPILDLTGDMKATTQVKPMSGAGVAITFDVDYASFHHTGTKSMVARPVLPLETMPASWNAALEEESAKAFEEILGEVE